MRDSVKSQSGSTLIELLISLVIGLIIAASMLGMYVTSTANSSQVLKTSKLNQELTTLMTVMVNDIRRAGFWNGGIDAVPGDNPFTSEESPDQTVLRIIDDVVSNTPQGFLGSGECILFAYDYGVGGGNGTVESEEIQGFRLNGTTVEILNDPGSAAHEDDCTIGTWETLTDSQTIAIDTLTFSLADATCLNTSVDPDEPNSTDDDGNGVTDDEGHPDCYLYLTDTSVDAPSTGDITLVTRQVKISLEGHLVSDPSVKMSLEQYARVRNDLVRVIP